MLDFPGYIETLIGVKKTTKNKSWDSWTWQWGTIAFILTHFLSIPGPTIFCVYLMYMINCNIWAIDFSNHAPISNLILGSVQSRMDVKDYLMKMIRVPNGSLGCIQSCSERGNYRLLRQFKKACREKKNWISYKQNLNNRRHIKMIFVKQRDGGWRT